MINLVSVAVGCFILTGCGRWEDVRNSNVYSPMRSGESFVISGKCYIDNGPPDCQGISYRAQLGQFESVVKKCEIAIDTSGIAFANVTFELQPVPLEPTTTKDLRGISLICSPTIIHASTDWYNAVTYFVKPITITPPSSAVTPITLSPGQQQALTVTLPTSASYSLGSKLLIVESQQYLSFVGNESSCTINSNQSSCSVTVQANSNITKPVNQTLRVVTSEFPTESVFIKIVPNTPPPPTGPKYIFVSQSVTAGNFGSFAAADAICNNDNAKTDYPTQLGSGTFKALLDGNNATTVGVVYNNLNDEVIATATTTNLVAQDAGLTNPIGKTPSGTQNGLLAWTGLAITGTPAQNCSNWTTNSNASSGTAGYVVGTSAAWSVNTPPSTCDSANVHLYCVQQ